MRGASSGAQAERGADREAGGVRRLVILDNLRVHHAKPVKAWLAEHADAIEVFYLPSYSPELIHGCPRLARLSRMTV